MAESGVVDLPPKKWTGLSCFQLHLDRADIADGGVATRSIVEAFDVGKDIPCGFCPCCIVPVVDELGLERVKEALDRNGGSGRHLAAAPRSPSARPPRAGRRANDPPSPSRQSCGCTDP